MVHALARGASGGDLARSLRAPAPGRRRPEPAARGLGWPRGRPSRPRLPGRARRRRLRRRRGVGGAGLAEHDPRRGSSGRIGRALRGFRGAFDRLFVGTRNTTLGNRFYGLDPKTGFTVGVPYDGADGGGLGIVSGGASVDYATSRVYFASRAAAAGASTVWCLEVTGTGSSTGGRRPSATSTAARSFGGTGCTWAGTTASCMPSTSHGRGGLDFRHGDPALQGLPVPRPERQRALRRHHQPGDRPVRHRCGRRSSGRRSRSCRRRSCSSAPRTGHRPARLYFGGGDQRLHELDLSQSPPTEKTVLLGGAAGRDRRADPGHRRGVSSTWAPTPASSTRWRCRCPSALRGTGCRGRASLRGCPRPCAFSSLVPAEGPPLFYWGSRPPVIAAERPAAAGVEAQVQEDPRRPGQGRARGALHLRPLGARGHARGGRRALFRAGCGPCSSSTATRIGPPASTRGPTTCARAPTCAWRSACSRSARTPRSIVRPWPWSPPPSWASSREGRRQTLWRADDAEGGSRQVRTSGEWLEVRLPAQPAVQVPRLG